MPLADVPYDGHTIDIVFVASVHHDDPHEREALRAAAEKDALTFRFLTAVMPGARWEQLLREHPPTGLDPNEYDWHPDTFPPAAIAESVTGWYEFRGPPPDQPPDQLETMTQVDAVELWGTWPAWARNRLFRQIEAQNVLGGALGKRRGRVSG